MLSTGMLHMMLSYTDQLYLVQQPTLKLTNIDKTMHTGAQTKVVVTMSLIFFVKMNHTGSIRKSEAKTDKVIYVFDSNFSINHTK